MTIHFSSRLVSAVAVWALLCAGCGRTPQSASTGPELSLMYNTEEQATEKTVTAQVIQSQLKANGIPVKLEPVTNAVFYDRIGKADYQAALALWYLDYDDPEGFLTDFYSKAGFRMAKYADPAYDSLYESGLFATTEAEKLQKFREATALIDRQLPWIPLYSNSELFALRKGTEGFVSNAYQYYDYRRVEKPELRVATDVEVQSLDPALAYDLASKHIVTQSYEGLVSLGPDGQILPMLATDWKTTRDGLQIDFHLRPGVKFHGRWNHPLAASDVKASFERMLRVNSPYSYIFDQVEGVSAFKEKKAKEVSGFVATVPGTFSIRLAKPFPTMMEWLLAPAAYIVPRETPDKFDFSKESVGTGPFVLRSWDGVQARWDSNGNYWAQSLQSHPLPRTLSLRVMKDINTQLAAFRQGELDILNIPLALFSEFLNADGSVRASSEYSYREVKLNNLKFITFNMQKAPYGKDEALRHRVAAALDRSVIVKDLFKGRARAATSIVPPEMFRANR
jgi:ABC-type oligopeptide transport system substrate-binding subunit